MNPKQTKRIRANLWKLNVFYGLKAAVLMIPILVPFFREHGMSMRDVFLLQGLFGVAILVLEVPSGFISDRLGRRRTLFVGTVFITIGMAVYPLAEGFYGFLLAELLLGVGFSFISGSDTALTWETLEALGERERYSRVLGRQRFIANSTEAVASIAGAALAVISMRLPMLLEAFVYAGTIPIALSLVEVEVAGTSKSKPGLRTIIRETFGLDRELRNLLLLSAVMSVSTLAMVWYCQPWFGEAGFPLIAFGMLWAVMRLGTGLCSLLSYRILNRFGFADTIRLLIVLIAVGYGGAALIKHPVGFVFLLLFGVIRGVSLVAFLEAINERIPGDRRATVLSCSSLLIRLIFAPLSPFLGWMADWWNLSVALAASGLLFAVGSALLFLVWRRGGSRRAGERGLVSASCGLKPAAANTD